MPEASEAVNQTFSDCSWCAGINKSLLPWDHEPKRKIVMSSTLKLQLQGKLILDILSGIHFQEVASGFRVLNIHAGTYSIFTERKASEPLKIHRPYQKCKLCTILPLPLLT